MVSLACARPRESSQYAPAAQLLPETQSPPGTTHSWNEHTSSPPQQLLPQAFSTAQHSPFTQTPSHSSSQVGPVVGLTSVSVTVTSSVVDESVVVIGLVPVGPAVESVIPPVVPVVCPSVSLPDIVLPPVCVIVEGVLLLPSVVLVPSVESVPDSDSELVEDASLSPQPATVNSASVTLEIPSNPSFSFVLTQASVHGQSITPATCQQQRSARPRGRIGHMVIWSCVAESGSRDGEAKRPVCRLCSSF